MGDADVGESATPGVRRCAIRGRLAKTYSLNRQWIASTTGNIYQYLYFDSGHNKIIALSVYEFSPDRSALLKRSYFSEATFAGDR